MFVMALVGNEMKTTDKEFIIYLDINVFKPRPDSLQGSGFLGER